MIIVDEAVKLLLEMEDINFQNRNTIELAFKVYSENNLDMLYAYNKNEKYDIKVMRINLLRKFRARTKTERVSNLKVKVT